MRSTLFRVAGKPQHRLRRFVDLPVIAEDLRVVFHRFMSIVPAASAFTRVSTRYALGPFQTLRLGRSRLKARTRLVNAPSAGARASNVVLPAICHTMSIFLSDRMAAWCPPEQATGNKGALWQRLPSRWLSNNRQTTDKEPTNELTILDCQSALLSGLHSVDGAMVMQAPSSALKNGIASPRALDRFSLADSVTARHMRGVHKPCPDPTKSGLPDLVTKRGRSRINPTSAAGTVRGAEFEPVPAQRPLALS